MNKTEKLNRLAELLKEALPLVDEIASDTFTEKDRATLRERAGKFTIFNLKNNLTMLSGEDARNKFIQDNAASFEREKLLKRNEFEYTQTDTALSRMKKPRQ